MMTFGAGVPKSGMMEIGIALVLHDRFSNQAAQASGAIRKLQQDARMAVQANLNQAYQLGTMGLGYNERRKKTGRSIEKSSTR